MHSGIVTLERARVALSQLDKSKIPNYERYFDSIAPKTKEDVFRRALFAFASVHTTWKLNCKLYELLAPLDWIKTPKLLFLRIGESGAGLHNNRFKFIWDFTEKFWASPDWYMKHQYENWEEYRDRLLKAIPGLGLAKAAFFSELVYFQHSHTACMDVHLLRLMFDRAYGGFDQGKVSKKFAVEAERAWVSLCLNLGFNPVTARWMYWDMVQQKEDPRYWSSVLEREVTMDFSGQMLLFPETVLINSVRLPGAA